MMMMTTRRRRNIPACKVSDDYYIVVVHTTGDNKDGSNQVTYAKKTKQLQSGTEMVNGQVFGHETFLFAIWVTRSHSCWSPKQCLFREEFKQKNGQIWEFVPIEWVGLHLNPNFLTGFKKCLECSETYNKLIIFFSIFQGGCYTQKIYLFFSIHYCFRVDILEIFLSIDALLNGIKTSCA